MSVSLSRMIMYEFEYDLKFIDWMAVFFRRNKTSPSYGEKVQRKTRKVSLEDGLGVSRSGLDFKFGHKEKRLLELRYECSVCEERYMPSVFW